MEVSFDMKDLSPCTIPYPRPCIRVAWRQQIYKCRTPVAGCGAYAGVQDPSAFSPFWPTHPDFRMYDSETMR